LQDALLLRQPRVLESASTHHQVLSSQVKFPLMPAQFGGAPPASGSPGPDLQAALLLRQPLALDPAGSAGAPTFGLQASFSAADGSVSLQLTDSS
jgi:hypothetical protein